MPLLKASYINHQGEKIEFGNGDGLFLNEHDLLNFSWDVQTRADRIIGVSRRGIRENTIPLIIIAQTENQAYKIANDLYSICEVDLRANKKGRLVINGYNLNCFICGQDYTEWADASKCLKITAKVIRDSVWYKTLDPITFNSGTPQIEIVEEPDLNSAQLVGESTIDSWTSGNKGYYYGYPYDYVASTTEYVFENDHGVKLSWKAIVYGPASEIYFYIGDHMYEVVDETLDSGEQLEITAKESHDEKTVYKIKADGTRLNRFMKRSQDSYLFEPINTGSQIISFPQDLTWRLIPIIERSSPKWQ